MVGNRAGEVKRPHTFGHVTVTYTDQWPAGCTRSSILRPGISIRKGPNLQWATKLVAGPYHTTAERTDNTMVERRIKPHLQQAAEDERRAGQRRLYRRNQVFGLLIVAAVILAWWLFHTNPRWIFPPGWWRP